MSNTQAMYHRIHARRQRCVVLSPLAVLTVAAAAACTGEAGATARWNATVDTIGDTVVVRTLSGRLWDDDAQLTPEVSIGVLEGADAYMLGNVNGLAVAPTGEIHVLDRQVPALRKYSADGIYMADLGRSGGGPGEYKNPDGGLAVLSDGRVLLRDPGNARINVYAADGSPGGQWPLPSGGGFNTSRKLYTDTADNSYAMVLLERDRPVTEWRYGLARLTATGEHTDTLRAPEWDYDRPVVSGQREGNSSSWNVPFTAQPSWTYSPLGYFIGGVSTDYRIDLFRANTQVLRIERAFEPVLVDAAEKAESEEGITKNFRDQFPGWRWNGPPIPDAKPPYRGIHAGSDGRIWVVLSQPSREIMSVADAMAEEQRTGRRPTRFSEPVAFDVFEPDGRYLGRVTAPEGFSTFPEPTFGAEHVWAVARDSLDVAYVVRYRIQPRTR
jgi:hypothetical protein